jgi:hypothetical protein
MTGTKYGCGLGICGSCTVHLDGRITRSCITPIAAERGREITTSEGLGGSEDLHPVQRAFLKLEVASEAVRFSQAAGRRVHVGWTREQDFLYCSFRPLTHSVLCTSLKL